jgi:hypothetical protein
MRDPFRTSSARSGLPSHAQDYEEQTAGFAGRLADRVESAGKRLEWIHGTLAVMMLVGLMSFWTWAVVQMVQTWAAPLHQARDQLLAHSSPL